MRVMKARVMQAVVSKTNSHKVESYWNSRADAQKHLRRFKMGDDFKIETRLLHDAPVYQGEERRNN